jgi:organic radical activating enzyme
MPTMTSVRGPARASSVKLKINGLCVNDCVFCPFHDDPSRLEVHDLEFFFDNLRSNPARTVFVNGGEPTIHPGFEPICDFLRDRFSGRIHLGLGTNLIPTTYATARAGRLLPSIVDTFDEVEVGCDDEHHNIDVVERLAPELINAGLVFKVNVVADYCSAETRHRLLRLRDSLPVRVNFSAQHHDYRALPKINDLAVPCRHRQRVLVLGCNGDAFFCAAQEMEEPLFNLHTVAADRIDHYVHRHDPGPSYRFCGHCARYEPDVPSRWSGVRRRMRALLGRAGPASFNTRSTP